MRPTPESLAAGLRDGLLHHSRGRLLEAAECYRKVAAEDPDDADALLLLGVLARETGQFAAAIDVTAKAVEMRPRSAHFHLNLALACLAAGHAPRAADCCQRALSLDPRSWRAWSCLAEIEAARDRHPESLAASRNAMSLVSGATDALELGQLLARRQRLEDALQVYAPALAAEPANPNLHLAAAIASRALGRTEAARAAASKALELRPEFPEAHLTLGNALADDGDFLGAARSFRRAILLRPRFANAYCGLGRAFSSLGRFPESADCYQRALALRPDASDIRHNLGYALLRCRLFVRAEACFREAARRNPETAQHHDGLGNALLQLRRPAEAEACYRQALALDPAFSAAHTNLANALQALDRHEEADRHYRRAVALDPKSAGGHYNLALSCLRQGNFREGWQAHEWRWEFRELGNARRPFPQPQWNGQPISGKTVLLHSEQGLGDTLMFVRYLPMVAARGARVVLETQPRLRRLLASTEGASEVVPKGESLPPFDYHCPLMSLPLAFGTALDTVPSKIPYVRADAALAAKAWRRHPRTDARPRVGLAWAGNPRMRSDRQRSITLEALAPLIAFPGAQFFSLQFGPAAAQLRDAPLDRVKSDILDGCSRDKDFADTAALMATLDLVVSVDTSVAHLAGAMGLPLWLLLPHLGDWRWLEQRQDSPWYPTARLFRQPAPGDWTAVAERVRDELAEFCRNHPAPARLDSEPGFGPDCRAAEPAEPELAPA